MKVFLKMLFFAIMLLTVGIAYAGESGIFTQQDQARIECDQGVPCTYQANVQIPVVAIVQPEYLLLNISDVTALPVPLYCINTYTAEQKVIYRQLNKSFRVTQASLPPASEKLIIKQNRLHFDPGNC